VRKLVDTMVWAASVNRRSPHHGEAREVIRSGGIVTFPNVLLELYNVLTEDYGMDGQTASSLVREISMRVEVRPVGWPEVEEALRIAAGEGIRVFDALILAEALLHGLDLVTFDRRLRRAWGRLRRSVRWRGPGA